MKNTTLKYGVWDPTHLYIDDGGFCYCGAHMGVESTYRPQAWTDLGQRTSKIIDGLTLRCEMPSCGK